MRSVRAFALRRLMTRDDRSHDSRRQERQPGQTPDVVREDAFPPGDGCDRLNSTSEQIVGPLAPSCDRLDESEISHWS